MVSGQQLAPYAHSRPARAALALPGGVDVPFVRGAITPAQVGLHRDSYINAILIQSRGVVQAPVCEACADPGIGLTPFPECRRIPGHFGGACGNCKWRDHGARCSLHSKPQNKKGGKGQLQIEAAPASGDGTSADQAIVLA